MFRIGRVTGIRETQAGLRASRKELRKVGNMTIRQIVDQRVVPTANLLAPRPAKGTMKGGSNARGAYLTTNARGQRRAIVAILNFGGTIRTPLVPKNAKALHWGGTSGGVFTAKVTAPRHITGKRWMERACELNRGAVKNALARELPRVIQAHIAKGS